MGARGRLQEVTIVEQQLENFFGPYLAFGECED